MTMTLAEWDEKIAPHLHGIEAGAIMCARHVGQLVFQPPFRALAEDEMEKLETVLRTALSTVRTARRIYQAKPLDD